MNERIQKLARQAFINAGYDTKDELFDILFKQGTEFHEKFADLIVAECAGIYSKIDNGNSHMGTDNYLEALHKTFRS